MRNFNLKTLWYLLAVGAFVCLGMGTDLGVPSQAAEPTVTNEYPNGKTPSNLRKTTAAMRKAAAAKAKAERLSKTGKAALPNAAMNPGGIPDYFGIGNWANSPIIRKFVDRLPGLGAANANNLGQYLPIAIADTTTYPGSDYYQIGVVDFTEQMNSDLPPTKLRGYKDLAAGADPKAHYLGPIIVAKSGRPVRVKVTNLLATGTAGNLFLPVDVTTMGAGMGPVDSEEYTQNRSVIHLHGGLTPWISDGTPHQWITPAGEITSYPKGLSQQNVPDMPDPGPGAATHYYSNEQSNRLMFYHDHVYGLTRLNVYAGGVAGYLITDGVEEALIDAGKIPGAGDGVYRYGIPLIIQDKTFVDAANIVNQDPTWNWGTTPPIPHTGDLWFPHVYMPNQNPANLDGANPFGRWDYGPWFWPPVTAAAGLIHGPIIDPSTGLQIPGTPNPSMVPEAFMDTAMVNGTAYPVLSVQRRAYRFRILNGCNDRFLNLQLYYVDPANPTEVKMVPAIPHFATPPVPPENPPDSDDLLLPPPGAPISPVTGLPTGYWPTTWPTDGRDGGVPDPLTAGPALIQIGTEGGFLPAPAVIPSTPIGYIYNRRDITVLNVSNHALFLGPAERADVIIDFSQVPDDSKIILYNDAPAPVPAFDPRIDYYTGDPDQTDTGGAPSTQVGFGPNTRTIMRFEVEGPNKAPFDLNELNQVWPAAYVASQDPPNVPETTYPAPYQAATDTYSRIQDNFITFTPFGSAAPITAPLLPKAIQELFELNYGRMNATLGVELPFTNINIQTTIPLGYVDPVTETVQNNQLQVWKITHNGVDTHAIHYHLFNLQLINRVGWDGMVKPPDPNELGWKETIRMNPLEDVIVALKPKAPLVPFGIPDSIRPLDVTKPVGSIITVTNPVDGNLIQIVNALTNFGYEYVWHCHLLGHEENDMMRPMVLKPLDVPADTIPPAATAFISPILDGNQNFVKVVIGAIDNLAGVGVASITYTASGNFSSAISAPVTVPGDNVSVNVSGSGATTITYFATDKAGNQSTPQSITAPTVPGAPTSVTAVAGNAQATVSFVAPAFGGSAITLYTVTSNPGQITATGTASPITVTGLTNGTAYSFTVKATNASGTGPDSSSSNIVTPGAPPSPGCGIFGMVLTACIMAGMFLLTAGWTGLQMKGRRNARGKGYRVFWMVLVLALVPLFFAGGCASPPPPSVLNGTWELAATPTNPLPETFLIFNNNNQVTEIQFVINGQTISQTALTGSTTVVDSLVTISQTFGANSINFVGTLNSVNDTITGTLATVLNVGGFSITLTSTPAIMWRPVEQ
jgi:FtsP/CotA-like multicopper oxidase with cupredoxin domain